MSRGEDRGDYPGEVERIYISPLEKERHAFYKRIDILQKQLAMALEALKYYQATDGSVRSLTFSTRKANDALAEIAKVEVKE